MKISIDWQLCVGAGCCLEAAPGTFRLVPGPDGPRVILLQAAPDEVLRRAAAACPTLAICLEDEAGRRYPQDLLGG